MLRDWYYKKIFIVKNINGNMQKRFIVILIFIIILIGGSYFFTKNIFDSEPYTFVENKYLCINSTLKSDLVNECQNYVKDNYLGEDCIGDSYGRTNSSEKSENCTECIISCVPSK